MVKVVFGLLNEILECFLHRHYREINGDILDVIPGVRSDIHVFGRRTAAIVIRVPIQDLPEPAYVSKRLHVDFELC